ncbi:unnamed protein product, partial [Staurois parvus]
MSAPSPVSCLQSLTISCTIPIVCLLYPVESLTITALVCCI